MIKKKTDEVLKTLKYPFKWQTRPKVTEKDKVVLSYHFFNQSNGLHGNGQAKRQIGTLQIDVFSVIDYSKTVNEIKKDFEKNKFRFVEMSDDIEQLGINQLFHKIIIFNYEESEVLNESI